MPTDTLSATEARRLAIVAQNLAGRTGAARKKGGLRVLPAVAALGVLQIDSVNVLTRAHYLPLFARLGPYDRGELDRCAWAEPRSLFEYWAHMASFSPIANQPLFRWRMARALSGVGTWRRVAEFAKEKRAYLKRVLAEVAARGAVAASELDDRKRQAGWWEWSDAKHAVETLFWQGRLAVATRRAGFERVYDLPERVFPAEVLARPTPDEEDAHRALIAIAGRALGIATEDDLADYFRLTRRETKPRVAELVEEGVLVPSKVEGWRGMAWRHRDLASGEDVAASALLAPFDPLVWYRPRALRLFDFHYRIGIYTPAHQRTHGYYVLPFLLGDALVARVDLKADRAASTLLVQGAWIEEGRRASDVAPPLAAELRRMAGWLELDEIAVARKGTLAAAVRASLRP